MKQRHRQSGDLELLIKEVSDSRDHFEHLLRRQYQFNDTQIQILYGEADKVIDASLAQQAERLKAAGYTDQRSTGIMMLLGYARYFRYVYDKCEAAEEPRSRDALLPLVTQKEVEHIITELYQCRELPAAEASKTADELFLLAAEDLSSFGMHFRKRLYRNPPSLPEQPGAGLPLADHPSGR